MQQRIGMCQAMRVLRNQAMDVTPGLETIAEHGGLVTVIDSYNARLLFPGLTVYLHGQAGVANQFYLPKIEVKHIGRRIHTSKISIKKEIEFLKGSNQREREVSSRSRNSRRKFTVMLIENIANHSL